jgi:hypothetical protein
MYDSVTVGEIPTDAGAVALYIDGNFDNWPKWTRKTNRLSIAVHAQDNAAALDIERGDATPAQAPAWVRRQLARGQWRPVVYAARDNIPAVLAELQAAGIERNVVRIWSAHIGQGPHICSPRSCGASFTADGTQWTFSALRRNLDESLIDDNFFPAKPAKKKRPKPPPVHKKVKGATGAGVLGVALVTLLHALGIVHLTPAEASAVSTFLAGVGGYLTPPKKL